ncbi:hypothetical protein JP39_07525 [Companilactobacillus heilongjiangensis]|uniref:Uncharacterized protein n=1 Tax=Companilactobacillus heilongjiangensis TaxID=1074467 RepID=A0A0K2LDH3_9LACO|nr:hypothetical protein JP39_07525 [Companilactobacillus heilongjiangensis]
MARAGPTADPNPSNPQAAYLDKKKKKQTTGCSSASFFMNGIVHVQFDIIGCPSNNFRSIKFIITVTHYQIIKKRENF